MATTLKINANRRNAIDSTPTHTCFPKSYDLKSGIFKPPPPGPLCAGCALE